MRNGIATALIATLLLCSCAPASHTDVPLHEGECSEEITQLYLDGVAQGNDPDLYQDKIETLYSCDLN